jgi:hypothetical protein
MSDLRESLCTIYVALAQTLGGDRALRQANQSIRECLEAGVIHNPTDAYVLQSIVDHTDDLLDKYGAPRGGILGDLDWVGDLADAPAH